MKKLTLYLIMLLMLAMPGVVYAGEMTLEDCIQTGLDNNLTLKQSKSKVVESQDRLRATRSSYLPNFSFDATYIRTEPISEFTVPGSSEPVKIGSENNYQYRTRLTQLIKSFGRVENAIAIASDGVDLARLDESKFTNDLVLQIKNDFYGVLLAGSLLDLAKTQEASVTRHLEVARQKYEAGTAAKFDVTRSEVSLASAQEDTILAGNAVDLSKAGFLNTMGISISTDISLKAPEMTCRWEGTEDECFLLAQKHRPELLIAQKNIDMARLTVNLEKSQLHPNLALDTSYTWANQTALSQPSQWNAAVNLNVPIYDGGKTPSRSSAAEQLLCQAELGRLDLERLVRLDIKQAVLNIHAAEKRIATAEKNLVQADEALKIGEVRYESGLGTIIELNDVQISYTQAGVSYATAVFALQKAIAQLEYAVGLNIEEINKASGTKIPDAACPPVK
ncbi:MAG: TolC family protein [Chloroflexi bacterium]|nr:TolC family protein [Chloroflexota bacterium]